jgi:hypothetical protein
MSFCPHCGQPGIFPNVVVAEQAAELSALDGRYKATLLDAAARGVDSLVAQFETAVRSSFAVRNVGELELRGLTGQTQMTSAEVGSRPERQRCANKDN